VSVPSSRTHTDAFLALLTAGGVTWFDNDVPAAPVTPYTVVYTDPGTARSPVLALGSVDLTQLIQCTSVGADRNEATAEVDAVRAALLEKVPVLAGRSFDPIEQEPGGPGVTKDDDTRTADGRVLFYGVTLWRIHSTPA
jgi:hypothetical protein